MLSESPLEQAGPFLSTRECPVLCLFWLMSAPAKHLHLSFYPSFYHPHTLSDLPNSPLLSFTQDSLSAAHLWRTDASRNVKSASI